MWQELQRIYQNKWDLGMVTLAPFLILVLFSSMFLQGKPEHLPIAILDQDHSFLSQEIYHRLQLNQTVKIVHSDNITQDINRLRIWGYVVIPRHAEKKLISGEDPQLAILYNQSFFSIGNSISSAMKTATLQSALETLKHYHQTAYVKLELPQLKVSVLYNPTLNYEFFLEPLLIPALLHLLLCCTVVFGVQTKNSVFSVCFTHTLIFCIWTWLWMFWLVVLRGWFIQGSLILILVAQFLFYLSYAFILSAITLIVKDLMRLFGVIAIYGGSALSFAGVTLPINNAPLFTQIWSHLLPYTAYAKLQTQQWMLGSHSFNALWWLCGYVIVGFCACWLMIKRKNHA